MVDVTYEEIITWEEGSYVWIDLRDEGSIAYGGIPGNVWIPIEKLEAGCRDFPRDKKIVLYCMRGVVSLDAAKALKEEGYDVPELPYRPDSRFLSRNLDQKVYCG